MGVLKGTEEESGTGQEAAKFALSQNRKYRRKKTYINKM